MDEEDVSYLGIERTLGQKVSLFIVLGTKSFLRTLADQHIIFFKGTH